MKTLTVSRWSVPAIAAILVALVAFAINMQPAQADGHLMSVSVKQASLADHAGDCVDGATGAHFIINQLAAGTAPASIEVTLSDGSTHTVPLSKHTGGAAHYDIAFASGLLVTDATANVPTGWTGQFVLSNYKCGPTTSTTSSSSSSSSSGTPTS